MTRRYRRPGRVLFATLSNNPTMVAADLAVSLVQ
jgi:hypothetical protein